MSDHGDLQLALDVAGRDPDHTYEHHPLCDDNGWDHRGPCIIETELPADPDDPNWDWGDTGQPNLRIAPITLRAANKFVGEEHRHHPPTQGHKFSVAVIREDAETVCGVMVAGRPVSRVLDGRGWLEVLRVATDGTPNACSALYGAAARIAAAMGYRRDQVITYTLGSEPGTSLVAAGWWRDTTTDGGEWDRPSRARSAAANSGPKVRWRAAKPEATS